MMLNIHTMFFMMISSKRIY